jgi:hypothetical protein
MTKFRQTHIQQSSDHQGEIKMKNLSFISIITLASVLLATGPALSQAPENMVLVPRGEFSMGSKHHKDEFMHKVVLWYSMPITSINMKSLTKITKPS